MSWVFCRFLCACGIFVYVGLNDDRRVLMVDVKIVMDE